MYVAQLSFQLILFSLCHLTHLHAGMLIFQTIHLPLLLSQKERPVQASPVAEYPSFDGTHVDSCLGCRELFCFLTDFLLAGRSSCSPYYPRSYTATHHSLVVLEPIRTPFNRPYFLARCSTENTISLVSYLPPLNWSVSHPLCTSHVN